MRKIILTGGTGYIGSNLARKLLEFGHQVFMIAPEKDSLSYIEDIVEQVTMFYYDGSDIGKLAQFFQDVNADTVFHLASLFIAEHKTEQIDPLIASNLRFGLHVLEAMSYSQSRCFINTGTSWQHFQNEPYNPVCLYAATKQAFESLLRFYVEARDFRAVTLKLFDTYGPGDKRPKLINLLKKCSEENTALEMSPGEQVLDFVYIDDVVAAFIRAMELFDESDIKFEDFGVSSGRTIKLRDFVEVFSQTTGHAVQVTWGGRPYRKREVMSLWKDCKTLPQWQAKVDLESGLTKIF